MAMASEPPMKKALLSNCAARRPTRSAKLEANRAPIMPLARIQLTRSPRRKLVKYAGISAGAGEGEEEKACPGSCCGYNWGGKVEEGVQTEEWELWLLWLLRLLLSRYEEANARPDAAGAGAGVVLLLVGAGQNPVRSFSMKSMAPPMLAQAYPLAKEPSAAVSATRRSEQVSCQLMPLSPLRLFCLHASSPAVFAEHCQHLSPVLCP